MSEQQEYHESDIASVAAAVDWYDADRTSRAFERLLDHMKKLEQQRDAALILAERLAEVADSEVGWEPLGAIFEEKP